MCLISNPYFYISSSTAMCVQPEASIIWNICMRCITGCCLNGRTAQPPSKSLIFWSFPNVLCLFDSSIWAIFIQVFLGHRIEKKSEKSHPQKSFNFRVGSNWHISLFLIFWVFCPQLPSKPSKLKCGGSFGKFREFAAR